MIVQANSFRIPLKDNSVHCVGTSVPYWGQRDYNLPPIIIGGREDCRHQWQTNIQKRGNGGERDYGSYDGAVGRGPAVSMPESALCSLCGAFYGSFGLEPTMGLHVRNAVLVCREIKRLLRPDGIFWLNYGDSFATSRNGRSAADGKATGNDDRTFRDKPFSTADELPAKNLCMIPARVAIALQDDGWIIRAAPPWVKRNPMPESVQDRPGTGHEYVFMLVKSPRYFYDPESVRRSKAESTASDKRGNGNGHRRERGYPGSASNGGTNLGGPVGGRSLRTSDFFFDSLDDYIGHLTHIRDNGGLLLDTEGLPEAFIVNPAPYKFAHYATWPPALVAPMIQASTSQKGCCKTCGAQWLRVKKPTADYAELLGKDWADYDADAQEGRGHAVSGQRPTKRNGASVTASYETTGWQPSCTCPDNTPIPSLVLDPFCGSGTTGEVAHSLGRRFIGLDLNPVYLSENALPRSEKKTSQKSLESFEMFQGALL